MTEENILCPTCGLPVSREDSYCRRCGTDLRKLRLASTPTATPTAPPPSEMQPAPQPAPPYERKYGIVSRLIRVLYKPAETMRDIALAPDYGGVIVVLVAQVVLAIIMVAYTLSKLTVTGPSAAVAYSFVSSIIVFAFALSFILLPVKWLVKSVIVQKACDAGSQWTFKSAASVTGYAYMPNLILSLITSPILIASVPTLNVDFSNLEAARQLLESFQSQVATIELTYVLPLQFLALLWKSYLGALGTSYGTKEMCKVSGAFLVFFLLGLITVAISLFT